MNPLKEHTDVLQNIEFAVVQVWHSHPEMTNYAAMRAYEAAIAYYGAIAREHTPKAVNLTGLDATLFAEIKKMCEWRLGRSAEPENAELPPLTAEEMVACLRKVRKSVDYWTQQGGRQGYMKFIEKFVS
jgi:hypothetical protein